MTSLPGKTEKKFDSLKPYTNHSQYLKDITLLGNNDTAVYINQLDNNITGNKGTNTVIFNGNSSEYIIDITDIETSVTDKVSNRDGINILKGIEKIKFTDQTIKLN